jgi:hypothetical protein
MSIASEARINAATTIMAALVGNETAMQQIGATAAAERVDMVVATASIAVMFTDALMKELGL